MATRLDVLAAVKALVEQALPGATVRGMDTDEAKPIAVGPDGMVIVRSGDPGPAEIDLSPPTYNYEHNIPVELAAYRSSTQTAQEVLAVMMAAIGAAIAADRFLGGRCTWLDADAPSDGETDASGAVPIGWADFAIIASYSTTNPLS